MSNAKLVSQFIISIIGVLAGISGIVAFCIYENQLAVVWAFIMTIYALMSAVLHFLYFKDKLETYYNVKALSGIHCFAVISMIIILGILCWYFFEIIYYKLDTYPIRDSYTVVAAFTFLSAKYATVLRFASHAYIQILHNSGSPLLQR